MTVADALDAEVSAIKRLLVDLIEHHSALRYEDNDHRYHGLIGVPKYHWEPLSIEGKRLQSKLLQEHKHYFGVLAVLLSGLPEDATMRLREHEKRVHGMVDQTYSEWEGPTSVVLQDGLEALDAAQTLLSQLYSSEDEWFVRVT